MSERSALRDHGGDLDAAMALYDVDSAGDWQARLARHHIWSRIFPYSRSWLRLGLPATDGWARLETALCARR